MIGLVIGSAKCIDKDLTEAILPFTESVGVNRAAIDFNVKVATTSEPEPVKEWQRFGSRTKSFLLSDKLAVNCHCYSNTDFYTPSSTIDEPSSLFYGHGNSAFPAIDYLRKAGCECIILSGVTLDSNWSYYHLDIGKQHDISHCNQLKDDLYKLAEKVKIVCINQNNFNPNFIQTITSKDILLN